MVPQGNQQLQGLGKGFSPLEKPRRSSTLGGFQDVFKHPPCLPPAWQSPAPNLPGTPGSFRSEAAPASHPAPHPGEKSPFPATLCLTPELRNPTGTQNPSAAPSVPSPWCHRQDLVWHRQDLVWQHRRAPSSAGPARSVCSSLHPFNEIWAGFTSISHS